MCPSVAESVRPDYGAQNTQVLGRRSSNGVLWTNVRRESDAVQRSRTPSASFLPHCVVILVGDVVEAAARGGGGSPARRRGQPPPLHGRAACWQKPRRRRAHPRARLGASRPKPSTNPQGGLTPLRVANLDHPQGGLTPLRVATLDHPQGGLTPLRADVNTRGLTWRPEVF